MWSDILKSIDLGALLKTPTPQESSGSQPGVRVRAAFAHFILYPDARPSPLRVLRGWMDGAGGSEGKVGLVKLAEILNHVGGNLGLGTDLFPTLEEGAVLERLVSADLAPDEVVSGDAKFPYPILIRKTWRSRRGKKESSREAALRPRQEVIRILDDEGLGEENLLRIIEGLRFKQGDSS